MKKLILVSITVSYLLINYSLLYIMPKIWNLINHFVSGKGLQLFIILYTLIFFGFLYFVFLKKIYKSKKIIMNTVLILSIFIIMFYLENNPGEKFHLIQYGIFGLLVFLSLEEFQEFSEKKKYLLSFIISLLAGGIDEGIQGLLPNRTFTWHDVFINFLSSFLVFHLFYIIKRELKKISIYDE